MLVISGRQPAASRPFTIRQGFDVEALARPVTKWQVHAAPGVDAGRLLAKAVFIATEEPAGPVYVELPADVGRTPASIDPRWQSRLRAGAPRQLHAAPRLLDQNEIARIDEILRAAERPLLIAGGRRRLDGEALAKLADARRMPALVTPNQKGVLPTGSDFGAGVFTNGVRSAGHRHDRCVTGGGWKRQAELRRLPGSRRATIWHRFVQPKSRSEQMPCARSRDSELTRRKLRPQWRQEGAFRQVRLTPRQSPRWAAARCPTSWTRAIS
jgi:thiamine pyrophosphate-dependent acetolactate synthase large subunit-like protein